MSLSLILRLRNFGLCFVFFRESECFWWRTILHILLLMNPSLFLKATAMKLETYSNMHIKFEYILFSNKNENACLLLLSDA